MSEQDIRTRVQQAVTKSAGSICPDPWLARRVIARGKEEKQVKKRISLGLVLVIVLALGVTGAALAATGAFDALQSLWQDSFRRMHTEGVMDTMDAPEAEAFLREFAEEYGDKEDLIISTVPGEGDLGLEEALAIARSAILDAFGTPEAELDAMGVYPSFYKTPYMDEPPEWRFYFTPRTGENIDDDHDYGAPGEYRVYIRSPKGEVTFCHWYNDDFWPEYALRAWDAGKRDYVFAEAKSGLGGFARMGRVQQEKFLQLFRDAGYDLSAFDHTAAEELAAIELEVRAAPAKDNLLIGHEAEAKYVDSALEAMESVYGLSREMLEKCCFAAVHPAGERETFDLCFAHNIRVEEEKINSGIIGNYECYAVNYAKRLGLFRVSMDKETAEVTGTVHIPIPEVCERLDDPETLLGRRDWTAADVSEYLELREKARAIDEAVSAGEMTHKEAVPAIDSLMLSYGGDPTIYVHLDESALPVSREAACEKAKNAVAEKFGLEPGEVWDVLFPSHEIRAVRYADENGEMQMRWEILLHVDYAVNQRPDQYVTVSVPEGEVTAADVISNG